MHTDVRREGSIVSRVARAHCSRCSGATALFGLADKLEILGVQLRQSCILLMSYVFRYHLCLIHAPVVAVDSLVGIQLVIRPLNLELIHGDASLAQSRL